MNKSGIHQTSLRKWRSKGFERWNNGTPSSMNFVLSARQRRCRERLAAFRDAGVDMPALMIDPVLAVRVIKKRSSGR